MKTKRLQVQDSVLILMSLTTLSFITLKTSGKHDLEIRNRPRTRTWELMRLRISNFNPLCEISHGVRLFFFGESVLIE